MTIALDNPENKPRYMAWLQQYTAASTAVETILVSNRDGLLLAGAGVEREVDLLAAISTATLSLADKLAPSETHDISDTVIINSQSHSILLVHVHGLILSIIGQENVKTGVLMHAGKEISRRLIELSTKPAAPAV